MLDNRSDTHARQVTMKKQKQSANILFAVDAAAALSVFPIPIPVRNPNSGDLPPSFGS